MLYGNSIRQERLLPGLLIQLLLASTEHKYADYGPIIAQWKQKWLQYNSLEETQQNLVEEQETLKQRIDMYTSRLNQLRVRKSELKKLMSHEHEELKTLLATESNLESWNIDATFVSQAINLSHYRSTIASLRSEIEDNTTTFINGVRNSITLAKLGPKLMSYQQMESDILDTMVEYLLQNYVQSYSSSSANHRCYVDLYERYNQLHIEGVSINSEKNQLNKEMVSVKELLSLNKTTFSKNLKELNVFRNRHPRLRFISN